jgi:hypothetical protein
MILGSHHTTATKRKLSSILLGRVFSKEWRLKISKANKGKPSHRKGKHLSLTHCRNISKAINLILKKNVNKRTTIYSN